MFSFAVIPLFVSGLAISYGTYMGYREYQQTKSMAIAQGIIIDNKLKSHYSSRSIRRTPSQSTYHPVVKFKAADGSIVQFTDSFGTRPPEYAVGASVEVLYNLQNKEQAKIKLWKRQWGFPSIIIAFGSLGIVVGIAASADYYLNHLNRK
uniref:DUF3592 domain-containing protein n=1 Tax=Cyanothece sp. (strain PCC 7425 / ATCC 29141) TaxID=395961 RepID=B8HS33_CYAP4